MNIDKLNDYLKTMKVVDNDLFALGLDLDLIAWRLGLLVELLEEQEQKREEVEELKKKVKDLEERFNAIRKGLYNAESK